MGTAGAIALGYLLGAIPFGALIGWMRGVDIRRYGSGRTGTTNVLRTLGAKAAAVVLVGDLIKGVAAVFLARYLVNSEVAQVGAGLAAVVGHNWPVFIGFRGGRGVTTGLGGLLALSWPVGLMALGAWAAIIAATRYVSLGSVLATALAGAGLAVWVILGWSPVVALAYAVGAPGIIIAQHRDNISRLLAGNERKLGQKVEIVPQP